jgi:hypothetical protein
MYLQLTDFTDSGEHQVSKLVNRVFNLALAADDETKQKAMAAVAPTTKLGFRDHRQLILGSPR